MGTVYRRAAWQAWAQEPIQPGVHARNKRGHMCSEVWVRRAVRLAGASERAALGGGIEAIGNESG
jgi:hypothetical protein